MEFKEFLKKIPLIDLNQMDLYNITSLKKQLLLINNKELYVSSESYIIVPYYILNHQIYELYGFNLYISNEYKDVYNYLEDKVKSRIENIPLDIIERTKHCFIDVYGKSLYNIYRELKDYLDFITNSQEFSNRVEEAFNQEFDQQNYLSYKLVHILYFFDILSYEIHNIMIYNRRSYYDYQ